MKEKFYIKSYCTIQDNEIVLNGESYFSSAEPLFADFIKSAYQFADLKYPKFFKMDKLSKLAFMGASLLLQGYNDEEKDIALVFSNKSSSLDTDLVYQKSISDKQEYYPSPAVFVYTLPNICLGEISIKYKLYSENSFFVLENFDAAFLKNYSEILLSTGKASEVLCGWTELLEDKYQAFLYLVSREGESEHNTENLNTYFRKQNGGIKN